MTGTPAAGARCPGMTELFTLIAVLVGTIAVACLALDIGRWFGRSGRNLIQRGRDQRRP